MFHENPKDRVLRASRLVNTGRFMERGMLGEGMKAMSSFPILV